MAVVTQFQFRRGTAAQWTSANPTLAAGEFGYETDTGKAKIGNGTTAWTSLSYAITGASGTVTSITAGTGLSGGTITGSGTIAIDSTVATLTGTQTLTNKTLTNVIYTQALLTPTFSANAYTLVLGDQGDILLASNGSTAGTINIPTNASVAFPTGTQITIIQTGAGQLTIQAASSGTTTVNSTGATSTAPKLRAQNSSATLIKTATDTWYVVGDIS
jgi:Major tropism determinant N-terminal domain